MSNDFPTQIVNETAHRPWPIPDAPWLMTQSWHDLLFAHWAVDPRHIREKVPSCFELDLFDGRAWIAVVPFHMTNVAPRFVPALPWVSAFAELNVRTYVTSGNRPGVFFFSLDAASAIAVTAARTLLHLPYFNAAMSVNVDAGDRVTYRSRRSHEDAAAAAFEARYHPIGPAFTPQPRTLEHFLTERYCLYNMDASYRPYRLEIHHLPWTLQPAQAVIDVNTMAAAAGIELPSTNPLLHFAKRQDTVAWSAETLA